MLRIGIRRHEAAEQVSVQHAEVIGDAETGSGGVVCGEHDAEVVVPHIRREVVAGDARDAATGAVVDDRRLQYLDDREALAVAALVEVDRYRDDIEIDRVAVCGLVVASCELVEPVVDHPDRVAEVLLAVLAACEVREVGGDARVVERTVVLVESDTLESEDRDGRRRQTHDRPFEFGRAGAAR